MSTSKQMAISGIAGGIAMGGYLISSHLLDSQIGYQASNVIGMLIAYSIDFFSQQYIFLGKLGNHHHYIIRFLIHISLEIVIAQLLLKLVMSYLKKHKPHFYKHGLKGIWISVIRYIIQLIIFFTITFPMRKYFVFV